MTALVASPTILLVTGSRSLAGNSDAETWAHNAIVSTMGVLTRELWSGDADGPDAWAYRIALRTGRCFSQWRLDGTIRVDDLARGVTRTRWGTRGDTPGKRWPLRRNAAMVEAFAACGTPETRKVVLALIDTTSATHGTEHTARLAEKAGLRVVRREWRP